MTDSQWIGAQCGGAPLAPRFAPLRASYEQVGNETVTRWYSEEVDGNETVKRWNVGDDPGNASDNATNETGGPAPPLPEACRRFVGDHLTERQLPLRVEEEPEDGVGTFARQPGVFGVECRVPPELAVGTWQVGLVNYDTLYAKAQNFRSFGVLPMPQIARVSPLAVSLGANIPLVLYGNGLGTLVRRVARARCTFRAVYILFISYTTIFLLLFLLFVYVCDIYIYIYIYIYTHISSCMGRPGPRWPS